jgi:hypothetical protein
MPAHLMDVLVAEINKADTIEPKRKRYIIEQLRARPTGV